MPWPRVETLTPWKQKWVCLEALDWTPGPGRGTYLLGPAEGQGQGVSFVKGDKGGPCASPVVLSYPELKVLQEAPLNLQDQESSRCSLISLHHPRMELTCSSPLHAKSLQSCRTLWNPRGCSPPGSTVLGILQARILEWVALPSSRDLRGPGIEPQSLRSPAVAGGFFTTSAIWEPSAALLEYKRYDGWWEPCCLAHQL